MASRVNTKYIAKLGQEIYDQKLKKILEPQQRGKFVAIDVDTGEYFINAKAVSVLKVAREKYPDKIFFLTRVGFPAAHFHRGFK